MGCRAVMSYQRRRQQPDPQVAHRQQQIHMRLVHVQLLMPSSPPRRRPRVARGGRMSSKPAVARRGGGEAARAPQELTPGTQSTAETTLSQWVPQRVLPTRFYSASSSNRLWSPSVAPRER